AILLWLLGALLLLGNISLFRNYLSNSAEKRAELARLEMRILTEDRQVSQLEAQLANSNLEQQNRQARFLNRRIAERTFSWSHLFDHLSQILPDGVRLTRLTPASLTDPKETQGNEPAAPVRPRDERVSLLIDGEAKSDEALSLFVNRLFAPPFDEPDLTRETREDEDLVKFDIKALYLPAGAASPPSPAAAPTSPMVEEAAPSGRMPALKTPNASDTPGVLQTVPSRPPQRPPVRSGRGA
ncbi:MAG TPA: PilN domain-containing protein, partial [Thermoanaerobaculia bacterium]